MKSVQRASGRPARPVPAVTDPDLLERPTAVTYDGLPLSAGSSHGLGRMPVRTAHARVLQFLERCTEPIEPIDYCFRIHDVPGLRNNPTLQQEVARQFLEGHTRFPFAATEADRALDFLESQLPQPTNEYGMAPLWLWLVTRVRLRDPDTGVVLPGQDPERYGLSQADGGILLGTSRVQLVLDNAARMTVGFSFPDLDDDQLRELVPRLQAHLPFTLSRKHWKRWTASKSGNGYLGRRITL
jgi:hypothetical protein